MQTRPLVGYQSGRCCVTRAPGSCVARVQRAQVFPPTLIGPALQHVGKHRVARNEARNSHGRPRAPVRRLCERAIAQRRGRAALGELLTRNRGPSVSALAGSRKRSAAPRRGNWCRLSSFAILGPSICVAWRGARVSLNFRDRRRPAFRRNTISRAGASVREKVAVIRLLRRRRRRRRRSDERKHVKRSHRTGSINDHVNR